MHVVQVKEQATRGSLPSVGDMVLNQEPICEQCEQRVSAGLGQNKLWWCCCCCGLVAVLVVVVFLWWCCCCGLVAVVVVVVAVVAVVVLSWWLWLWCCGCGCIVGVVLSAPGLLDFLFISCAIQ